MHSFHIRTIKPLFTSQFPVNPLIEHLYVVNSLKSYKSPEDLFNLIYTQKHIIQQNNIMKM